MNSKRDLSKEKSFISLESDEDINLLELVNIFKRNKRLIGLFSAIGILSGLLISFSSKKVWEGTFQIVIKQSTNNNMPISARSVESMVLSSVGQDSKKLNTEVEILKSPSILMEIFNFVQDEKTKFDGKRNLDFNKWRKDRFKIELLKRTSVLNITYNDDNKEIILPVLNKISTAYQNYSGKERLKNIENALSYLDAQLLIYSELSRESSRELQEFAYENDLAIFNQSTLDKKGSDKADIIKKGSDIANIEIMRVKAINDIRNIDEQLATINLPNFNLNDIVSIANNIEGFDSLETFTQLQAINSKLEYQRSVYKEKDPLIRQLLREKNSLNNVLKNEIIYFLNAKKSISKGIVKASQRPKEVLIKYKELTTKSLRDEMTINKLEEDYRRLSLEKARNREPWELITKPTLNPEHVSPNKPLLTFLGTSIGFLIGILTSIIYERKKNQIFNKNEFQNLIKYPLLEELSINNQNQFINSIDFLIKGPISVSQGDIGLIRIGLIEKELVAKIKDALNETLVKRKVIYSDDFNTSLSFHNQILLVQKGLTKRNNVYEILRKLELSKTNIIGFIILDDSNKK